jgi:hypothetical protein
MNYDWHVDIDFRQNQVLLTKQARKVFVLWYEIIVTNSPMYALTE